MFRRHRGRCCQGLRRLLAASRPVPEFCPSVGVAFQCPGVYETKEDASALTCPKTYMNNTRCVQATPCPTRSGLAHPFDTMFCRCDPTAFDSCYFVPGNRSCDDGAPSRINPRLLHLTTPRKQLKSKSNRKWKFDFDF